MSPRRMIVEQVVRLDNNLFVDFFNSMKWRKYLIVEFLYVSFHSIWVPDLWLWSKLQDIDNNLFVDFFNSMKWKKKILLSNICIFLFTVHKSQTYYCESSPYIRKLILHISKCDIISIAWSETSKHLKYLWSCLIVDYSWSWLVYYERTIFFNLIGLMGK